MNIEDYKTKDVHISTIKHGDTILHVDGCIRTVGNNNIKRGFCGITLFGNSYIGNTRLVTKILI